MADSPFYQNARQNFSSSQSMQQPQGGFGGFGGGYQMPQQNWGGGFGGGYGSGFGFGGGFQPSFGGGFGGGYGSGFSGGFQPQQQFNPFQGGFGGFGGGYNPMFGGIGGLGFNPMMGQGFGMPMQGFGFVEDRPTPQQSLLQPDGRGGFFRPEERRMPMQGMRDPRVDMLGQQFGFASEEPMRAIHQLQNPFEDQQRQLRTQMEALPEYQAFQAAQNAYGAKQQELPEFIAAQNAQRALENSDALKSIQQKQQELQRMQEQPRQPMYGGLGGVDNMSIGPGFGSRQPMYGGLGSLGFNPMMGPQFGMPMLQGMQANSPQGRVAMGSLGGMNIQPLSAEQQQLLNQLPQQTQASPSGDSFARLAQMFSGRTPQNSSEPQQPAPPGMKWMLGYGGYSLVPEGLDTSVMG